MAGSQVQIQNVPPEPSAQDFLQQKNIPGQPPERSIVSEIWRSWFTKVRIKLNTINAAVINISTLVTAGFVSTDGNGNFFSRTITGTTNDINVANGTGAAGNPTISSANTGVAAGYYTNANITVTAMGKLTAASSGSASGTVTSVGLASPSQFTVTGSPVTGSGTLTFAWNVQAVNTVLAGPSSGSSAAPTFRSLVVSDIPNVIPQGYIDGLVMLWNSSTSISVTSGSAYILSGSSVLAFPSTLTLSGLSLSASTFYHLYGFNNSGTAAIELVTTAPATAYNGTARAKTSDTSRRYIGSVLTDASGNVQAFTHTVGHIYYVALSGAGPASVLASGAATVSTAISLTGIVPVTARAAILRCANNAVSVNQQMQQAVGVGTFVAIPGIASGIGSPITVECPIANQAMAYMTGGAGGSANISVLGYSYER